MTKSLPWSWRIAHSLKPLLHTEMKGICLRLSISSLKGQEWKKAAEYFHYHIDWQATISCSKIFSPLITKGPSHRWNPFWETSSPNSHLHVARSSSLVLVELTVTTALLSQNFWTLLPTQYFPQIRTPTSDATISRWCNRRYTDTRVLKFIR